MNTNTKNEDVHTYRLGQSNNVRPGVGDSGEGAAEQRLGELLQSALDRYQQASALSNAASQDAIQVRALCW